MVFWQGTSSSLKQREQLTVSERVRGISPISVGFNPRVTKVRKGHCHVFLGGLDPGQAPLKTLLLMLRVT